MNSSIFHLLWNGRSSPEGRTREQIKRRKPKKSETEVQRKKENIQFSKIWKSKEFNSLTLNCKLHVFHLWIWLFLSFLWMIRMQLLGVARSLSLNFRISGRRWWYSNGDVNTSCEQFVVGNSMNAAMNANRLAISGHRWPSLAIEMARCHHWRLAPRFRTSAAVVESLQVALDSGCSAMARHNGHSWARQRGKGSGQLN